MKRNSQNFLIFLAFILLVASSTSARLLEPTRGEKVTKINGISEAGSFTKKTEDFSNLMGSEVCDEKDEECMNRRMVEEAHLDYIYTQHHKPKP